MVPLAHAGFTEEQAETQTQIIAELMDEQLATKQDLKELESRLKADIIKWVAGMFMAQSVIIIGAVFALLRAFLPT